MPSLLSFDRLLFGPEVEPSVPLDTIHVASSEDETSSSQITKSEKNGFLVKVYSNIPITKAGRKECSAIISRFRRLLERPYATWYPTFLQPRAIIGLLALLIAISCVFGSLAILLASDEAAVADWTIQPTVYLAIFTAISNASLALARLEAAPISWWYSVSQGRSVRSLERQWQTSRSILQAFTNIRYISLLNVACILVAVVIIDGPFLQRASTVIPKVKTSTNEMHAKLVPELPAGFSGIVKEGLVETSHASQVVVPDYASNVPMELEHSPQCIGTCQAKVLAPGVAKRNCSSHVWPITYAMMHNVNATWGSFKVPSAKGNNYLPLFYVEVGRDYEQITGEAAKITTGIAGWSNYSGSFVETTCYLLPAVLEYEIDVNDGKVTIAGDASEARVVSLANNTVPLNTTIAAAKYPQNDTMDVITVGVSILAQSKAKACFSRGEGQKSWTYDSETYNLEVFKHQQWSKFQNLEHVSFSDPMPGIISKFNQMFFRGATMVSSGKDSWKDLDGYIDPGLSTHQTVLATQVVQENVYHSDLRWFAAAAVLELTTVLILLPMFWGWWTLGCDLSMSPFTVALAFNSSVLKNVNSAAGGKGVVEEMGDIKLKMGVVDRLDECMDLKDFSDNKRIRPGRFGVAVVDEVVAPHFGDRFLE